MNNITKAIKEATGLKINEFCEKELGADYKAFIHRMRNNSLYPSEIFYIIWRTKKTVHELFGKGWTELVIENQGGPMLERVKEIIGNLNKDELNELSYLLGYHDNKSKEHERHKVNEHTPDVRRYPLTPDQVTQAPGTEPKDAPKNEDPFDKLIIKLY